MAGRAGSGKSTVARFLAQNPTIEWMDLDAVAWRTYASGTSVYDRLIDVFGRDILNDAGEIDRARLARSAFATPKLRQTLDKLVHPAVSDAIKAIICSHKGKETQILLIEGALLASSPYVDRSVYHAILWLETSDDARSKRLRAAGRGAHVDRSRDVTPVGDVVVVSGEGAVEAVADRILTAIAEIPGPRSR